MPSEPPNDTTALSSHTALADITDGHLHDIEDAELLALALGSSRDTAGELLRRHEGLRGLALAAPEELALEPALDLESKTRLQAALELGKRGVCAIATAALVQCADSRATLTWGAAKLAGLSHEELWLLALDGRCGLRSAHRVAMGGIHGMQVVARDPLRIALRAGASMMILVHNHPSGDPTPSREDVLFTAHLSRAADIIGVPLVDHVVVAARTGSSMLDLGLLPASPPAPRRHKMPRARRVSG